MVPATGLGVQGARLYLVIFGSQAYRHEACQFGVAVRYQRRICISREQSSTQPYLGYRHIGVIGYQVVGQYSIRLVSPYAYWHGACRIYRAVRCGFGRTVVRCQRQGRVQVVMQQDASHIRSNQRAVTCLFKSVVVGYKPLRSQAYWHSILLLDRNSIGVSAQRLVVPVQNPQRPSLPRSQQLLFLPSLGVERHTPRLVALDPLGIEKGSKCSVTEVGTNQNIIY